MFRPLYTNRLVNEKSPYLLQHAHNPIDWYPWGEEAFVAAKEEDKPIFLSIGYATCHWCHVMEEESFSNPDVAKFMNKTFVNIKVDREEMPEVDSLYMEFAQAIMSGGAGWPLNVILTPDLMPFFATTYLPPETGQGMMGLRSLSNRIDEIWKNPEEREKVVFQAGKIVEVFASSIQVGGNELPTQDQIGEAANLLFKMADPIYGGTKGVPKFPIGFQVGFLLRFVKKTADSRALFYVERTLDMMHRGGIYDHLGGGFSRYTVDERWQVPHFEKMLYDNAILARSYLEAWEFTRHHFYREVCQEILGYISREMTDEQGGFFSAQDADSEGEEGQYYTWSKQELEKILDGKFSLFSAYYGVTPGGNFGGRNILHTPLPIDEFAKERGIDTVSMKKEIDTLKSKLFEVREKRGKPQKDDKVIASWNGLMIYSFAEAGRAFHSKEYLSIAHKAALFIKNVMWKDEILYRRWRGGETRFEGCLDDYAFVISGFLSLFEADLGTEWLKLAIEMSLVLKREFKSGNGAFFLTKGQDPSLLIRRCEFYDGAEPSGNAVHAENLFRLYQMTGDIDYKNQMEDILKGAKDHIAMYPPGACYHLMALQRYYDTSAPTIVIALNEEEQYAHEIARIIAGSFIPHKSVIWRHEGDGELLRLISGTLDKVPAEGKTTVYLCQKGVCREPLTELSKIWEALERL
ncbi:MAG: thioredoxin domain-containing protein [Chlamydiia bacterium]|nr:thioredoxin domain-containing protein [Chlamydiia bacterium]